MGSLYGFLRIAYLIFYYGTTLLVRTQDKKGNSTRENIPKLAPWLHLHLGYHPLDVVLSARWEGDGFAPV
jgi:hypothetical protein